MQSKGLSRIFSKSWLLQYESAKRRWLSRKQKTASVGKVVEKLEPSYMAGGVKNDTLLWKTACQFLKLVNTGLSCNPAISLLVLHPRELKTHVHTNTCAEMFIVY